MDETANSVELAAELTIAWLSNSNTRAHGEDVPAFLAQVHQAVRGLQSGGPSAGKVSALSHEGAVSVRKSLASKDHIISMIDGKPYKTLRRHLSAHGLTPEQYRERYDLKSDYPMTAETYSRARSDMARKGLGRKPGQKAASKQPRAKAPAKG